MRALVLGATGQIGHFLVSELCRHGVAVEAVSRQAQASREGVLWSRFDLYRNGDATTTPDVVFSTGPLDGLLAWLARTRHRPGRVIAFSSTSAATKRASPDPAERALAAHLQRCETALIEHCQARAIGWTILRPTLVYGCGMDANLSRIAALARRWRMLPLPRDATGLRQPVHAQDLAVCAWRAAGTPESQGRRYDLPGGDTLSYIEMVRRTVACLSPPGHVVPLPAWLFGLASGLVSRLGMLPGLAPAMLARMRQDLVFGAADAVRDLGWSPRGFAPDPTQFERPASR